MSPQSKILFALLVPKADEAQSSFHTPLKKNEKMDKTLHFDLKERKKGFFHFFIHQEIFSANWCLIKLLICVFLPPITEYQSFLALSWG